MVKKWIDIDKVIKPTLEIEEKLWKYQEIMQEIPNFNKTEGVKKIYSRKEYIILQVKRGYVVYNQNKTFKEGHTHIRSYKIAKTIIDNCINRKRPKTNNIYLLESYIRISNNEKYINEIKELINSKKYKSKEKYINVNINER